MTAAGHYHSLCLLRWNRLLYLIARLERDWRPVAFHPGAPWLDVWCPLYRYPSSSLRGVRGFIKVPAPGTSCIWSSTSASLYPRSRRRIHQGRKTKRKQPPRNARLIQQTQTLSYKSNRRSGKRRPWGRDSCASRPKTRYEATITSSAKKLVGHGASPLAAKNYRRCSPASRRVAPNHPAQFRTTDDLLPMQSRSQKSRFGTSLSAAQR